MKLHEKMISRTTEKTEKSVSYHQYSSAFHRTKRVMIYTGKKGRFLMPRKCLPLKALSGLLWKHRISFENIKLCVNWWQYYIDADSLIKFLDLVMTCSAYLTAVIINTAFIKNKIRSFLKHLCICVWTCLSTFIVKPDSRNILSQMTRASGTQ